MENELTDRKFWKTYWEKYIFTPISNTPIYKNYIPKINPENSFIEIGGFPGFNAVYFYKNVCRDVTIVDFFVEEKVIRRLEAENQLPLGTIKAIESDFFQFSAEKKYDFVFSSGFIEHFLDTKGVIERHLNLLNDGGDLLIVLPNFRGLNGLFQRIFDQKNLLKHNLESMKISNLQSIVQDLELTDVKIEYTKKPMVWIEPAPGILNKGLRNLVKIFSYAIKLIPIKGRILSPYIVISAKKHKTNRAQEEKDLKHLFS